jgi:triosephosphate isomerase
LRFPVAIVNFKAYEESTLANALRLARICEKVSLATGIEVVVAVSAPDLREIANAVKIPVFAQHADPVGLGAHTGKIPPALLAKIGVKGTLLNHSENRIPRDQLRATVELCKESGLEVVVFAQTTEEAAELAKLKPTAVAIEPPELIGSGRAVSRERPELLTATLSAVKAVDPSVPVLCGAGIVSGEDVKKAIELGRSGIAVASGVVKAHDPEVALRDMVLAMA